MKFHSTKKEEVLQHLTTNAVKGLTEQEAQDRLAKNGPNKLKEKKKKSLISRFLEQFKDAMIIILLVAAVVSFVIACREGNPK